MQKIKIEELGGRYGSYHLDYMEGVSVQVDRRVGGLTTFYILRNWMSTKFTIAFLPGEEFIVHALKRLNLHIEMMKSIDSLPLHDEELHDHLEGRIEARATYLGRVVGGDIRPLVQEGKIDGEIARKYCRVVFGTDKKRTQALTDGFIQGLTTKSLVEELGI